MCMWFCSSDLAWSSLEMSSNSSWNCSSELKKTKQHKIDNKWPNVVFTTVNDATIVNSHPPPQTQWCNNDITGYDIMLTHLKLCGLRKLSRWNSSSRLFCRGVPVSRSLYLRSYTLNTRKNCSQDRIQVQYMKTIYLECVQIKPSLIVNQNALQSTIHWFWNIQKMSIICFTQFSIYYPRLSHRLCTIIY